MATTDEDLMKKYAPELQGMPVALATVAARNLAAQDSSISSVNATNRIFSRSPGIGAYGSTPETDAQNRGIATAMDRADGFNGANVASAIQFNRGEGPIPDNGAGIDIAAVNSRRNQILNGVDPDRPALFVNTKREAELNHELGTLTNIAHEHALETAQSSHQDLVKQRSIDVATGSANIFNGLKTIKPDGSPESGAAIHQLVRDNHLAFDTSPAVRAEVEAHAKAWDSAALRNNDPVVDPKTGLVWNGNRWVKPPRKKQDKVQAVAENDLAKAGLTPEEFAVRGNVRRGKKDEKTKEFTNQYSEANKGDHMAVDVGGKTFSIPLETFQRLDKVIPAKAAVPAQSVAQMQPTATTATGTAAPAPDDIRAQYKAGKLTKDQATEMLKKGHGFE